MANKFRGQVSKKVGNLEYVFVINTNAICRIEDHLKAPFSSVISDLESGSVSFKVLRTLIYEAALKHHPDFTESKAGDLMDEMGVPAAGELLGECVKAAFPEFEADEGNALREVDAA